MPLPPLIDFLHQRLQTPLPGLDAQMTMAPPIRGRKIKIPPDVRRSAVMLLLYQQNSQWYVPFMRRAEDGRVHGGQVSLPGGRHDKNDPDFTYTAFRETEEEFGIPPAEIELLGNLTELYIPPSNSLVYPRIGFLPQKPTFRPDPREVAEILEVPAEQFLDPKRKDVHRVDVFGGNFIQAPGYTVNGKELIWGATAMMMAEFSHLFAAFLQQHD